MRRIDLQRGFSLVEVMVATLLVSATIVTFGGTITAALHAQANATRERLLDDDALGALADLRALTVYDPAMLSELTSRSASQVLAGSVAGETIALRVTAGSVPGALAATATATAGETSVTERVNLYAEAPAPGSTVNQ